MDNIQLTPHFSLYELLVSETAVREGYSEQFEPGNDIVTALRLLCTNVLEPLRTAISASRGVDTPIIITSGYRCARVNGAVPGAAAHSQHQLGMAADTHVEGMTIEEWYQFIKASGIVYDQLIQEHDFWAHVSFDWVLINQRKQNLRATGTIQAPVYTADND